jgi:hypothetical protein
METTMTEFQTPTTYALPFAERADLGLDCDLGSLHLVPVADGEQPRIEITGYDADEVEVEVRQDGDRVKANISHEGRIPRPWFGRDARITVHLPRELRATVRTDAGAIDARDLGPCELSLTTDAGRLRLHNISGRIKLQSDAGQIKGEGLSGSLNVETDAGKVDLDINALDAGEHKVRTDVGAISITLAPEVDVRVEARASIGSARSDVPSRPDAAAVLRVTTDVGSVRVRRRGSGHTTAADEGNDWDPRAWVKGTPFPPVPPIPPIPPVPPVRPFRGRGWFEREQPGGGDTGGSGNRSTPREPDPDVERILKMVESGQISAKDADELLRAMDRE